MSPQALEHALRNLPSIGTLVKDRPQRQIWRFAFDNKAYYLKFYPRQSTFLKRLVRGNPAAGEFARLQWLQKAKVPAPHVYTWLQGFRINDQIGDAVIMDAIEPSIPLDRYFNDLELAGKRSPDHLQIAEEIRSLIRQLALAGLGHSDLHLANMLLSDGKVYLLDAHAVHRKGVRLIDLLLLAHSVNRYATTADLVRAWQSIGPGGDLPLTNSVSKSQWRKALRRIWRSNEYFGRSTTANWRGVHFNYFKYPRPWSRVSNMRFTDDAWSKALPPLLAQIESDQLEILKRSPSGDVLAGEIILDGRPIPIIIKRPRRKYLHRYLNEIGRGSRAARAWRKAWTLVFRDIPTAWPMLLLQRRILGYAVDSLIVFERIEGKNLADADLNEIPPDDRQRFFQRAGRLLRRLDNHRLYHWDAKATNFMVAKDPLSRPTPLLVDVDGIRKIQWTRWSIDRLLRSMRQHPQYAPNDSFWLCKGYAPFARIQQEQPDLPITK